ncbi:MAG: tRNA (adenosine(37)-N6)-dimethylallyltransferase MiaA [Thermomicrobiales bacterium]
MHESPSGSVPPPVVALVGPTGVGKTALSIAVGQHLAAEIVNADSRSFYRGMDIGTAKVSPEDRALVPHHLVDILDPTEPMSLATFQDRTYETIAAIHARRHVPLLVGGTPQYVNAVMEGWSIPRVAPDEALRQALADEAERDGVAALAARLAAVDPVAAEKSGANLRRIIRALEVYEATGQPITALQEKRGVPFATLEFELWAPRDLLYERIDRRVDAQIADGLVDEVRSLRRMGVPDDAASFSSIGYRQLLPFLRGEGSLDDAVERIKLDSHRLVRHQQTWFRKNPRLIRIDTTEPGWDRDVIGQIDQFVAPWMQLQGRSDAHRGAHLGS